MKRMIALAGSGLLAVTLVGCGDLSNEDLTPAESPLLGGIPTTARPEVGQFFPSTGGMCTATMISTRTFVSAAHCIGYQAQSVGGTLALPSGNFSIERTFSQGGQLGNDDISFGRITSAAPISPAALSTVEPSAGTLTAIGYGCTDSRSQGCTTAGSKTYVQYQYNGSTPSNINAPGDSGGPTFIGALSANGPMVRIASGYHTDAFGNTNDIGADTVQFRNQIVSMDSALNTDGVSYRSQVQSMGWTSAVNNGTVSGTTGQSLRLEGLQVWSPRAGVSVCYQAYVQNVGWQAEVCNGSLSGTVGQGLRMEAVKIRLAAKPAGTNGIRYNSYLQGIGWQGQVQDGAQSGTTGQSRRIEAISIQLY